MFKFYSMINLRNFKVIEHYCGIFILLYKDFTFLYYTLIIFNYLKTTTIIFDHTVTCKLFVFILL